MNGACVDALASRLKTGFNDKGSITPGTVTYSGLAFPLLMFSFYHKLYPKPSVIFRLVVFLLLANIFAIFCFAIAAFLLLLVFAFCSLCLSVTPLCHLDYLMFGTLLSQNKYNGCLIVNGSYFFLFNC